ncbi:HNH endonuclease [Pseudoduganella sp. R-31]|uniref:HNH endonuclease n=1 Tax=Pseudoduganella sp. R-31 TaxID=3404060 RepID=UPI003CECE0F7
MIKLPNFIDWAHLNQLRQTMGAPLAERFGKQLITKEIALPPIPERLHGEGIDVAFDEIQVLEDGTLGYKGYRVLVYIRDVPTYGRRSELPKFHITYCTKLEQMRRNNRWSKYVVANRDDGKFKINLTDQGVSKTVPLNVCQMCLAEIAWKKFRFEMDKVSRTKAVNDFALSEFFEKYPRDLLAVKPDHTSDTAPRNDYVFNWKEISDRTKKARNYTCEKCLKRFIGPDSRFVDTHHRNALKYDNSDSNLEVLCIGCHAEEPMHTHMKSDPRYKEYVRKFR